MSIAILVVGFLSYIAMASLSYQVFREWRGKKYRPSSDEYFFVGIGYTVFWPVGFTIAGGLILGEKMRSRSTRPSRSERRRREELAEAQHQLQLAKLHAEKIALLTT